LLVKEPGQSPEDLISSDGSYVARAQKVLLQDRDAQAVSIQSPILQSSASSNGANSTAKFDLSFNASKTTSVSVRTSVQPKSKWAMLPTNGSLLSDLIDCTVFRDGASVSTSAAGFERVAIELEFPLQAGTGAGSRDAFVRDKSLFKLMFVDANGQLSASGCDTIRIEEIPQKPMAAKLIASCNHLTVFGVVGAVPAQIITPPSPPPPIPLPPSPPSNPSPPPPVVVAPPPPESSPSFPVWASVLLAAGGFIVLVGVGYIVKKRKEELDGDRVKQIVAASSWKQTFVSADVLNKPTTPQSFAPSLPPSVAPRNTSPTTAASTRNAPSPLSNRQLLADLAGAIERGEQSVAEPPAHLQFNSRSHSPVPQPRSLVQNSEYSRSFGASLKLSSPQRDAQAYSPPSSNQAPSASSSPRPSSPSDSEFRSAGSLTKSRDLPRSQSPYSAPSNFDDAQMYSSLTSSARLDPVSSSLRTPGSKTIRQQLADLAAASAENLSQHYASSEPAPSSSPPTSAEEAARARSSSRGRLAVPSPSIGTPTLPSPSIGTPSIPRSARQLMAEIAAAGDGVGYEQRDASQPPRAAISSNRLPRSLSRPILSDPDDIDEPASNATGRFQSRSSPLRSRLAQMSPGSRLQSSSPQETRGRAVPAQLNTSTTLPSRVLQGRSPAGFSDRSPSLPSRQSGGNRYDQV
jgi:hypothetical protein